MGNYGNHNRNILGSHGAFPDDKWESYQDGQRLGKSDYVAPGKTVRPPHYTMRSRDYSIDENIATMLESLNNPIGGNKIEIHYKLGCLYKKKGDWAQAKLHLGMAAKAGHSDAKEELASIGDTWVFR